MTKKYGKEQRYIFTHKFSLADNDLAEKVGISRWNDQVKKLYLDQWTREARVRGLVDLSKSLEFSITRKGYDTYGAEIQKSN